MKRFNIVIDDLTYELCKEIIKAHESEDIILDIEYYPRCVTIENKTIKVVNSVFEQGKEKRFVENDITRIKGIDKGGDRKWEVTLNFSDVDFILEDTYTTPSIGLASREVTHLVFLIKKKDISISWKALGGGA